LGDEHVVAVGSIINTYLERGGQGLIFGSGVRKPDLSSGHPLLAEKVIGVRGHLTAEALDLSAGMVIGDPGLLIGRLVAPARPVRRRAVFVPHFSSLGTNSGRRLVRDMRSLGFNIVLPNATPQQVAREISSATFVLATSLHALVFADAYGVPCARPFDESLREPDFKYMDYRSVFGIGLASVTLKELARPGFLRHLTPQIEEEHEQVASLLTGVVTGLERSGRVLSQRLGSAG
jgi:hypothetical protein